MWFCRLLLLLLLDSFSRIFDLISSLVLFFHEVFYSYFSLTVVDGFAVQNSKTIDLAMEECSAHLH